MRVSILIDNYNYDAYIAECIESALNQTYADVEVIVIDDGSRDKSMDVIQRYAGRLAAIIEKPNGGQASAYNRSFERCAGDIVMWLDADDHLYPEAIERIVAAWGPGVSKVQFRLDLIDAQSRPLGRQLPRYLHEGSVAAGLMREFGAYGSPPGSGNAYARTMLQQLLPIAEDTWRTGADSIPILLAPAHGLVISIEQPLGAYRVHRPANDGGLVFNNSPSGLRAEFERIMAGKKEVSSGLARIGMSHHTPLWLAPWEVRTLALCRRFGEPELGRRIKARPDGKMHYLIRSVWRWPVWPISRKLALTCWLLAVELAPARLALHVARMHRRAAGLPVAEPA
jgi:glycosyltransferase involved in cell wall biosynthesis